MVRVDPDDVAMAKAGDRAACGRVVESMEGIVVGIAMSYARRSAGFDKDDLLQEARIVVARAVRFFKPESGFAFSTYAAECVRRRLYEVVNDRKQQPLGRYDTRPDADANENDRAETGEAFVMDPASDPDRERSRERLADVLGQLDVLSRMVVQLRLGLQEHPLSFHAIASRLGIRIRSAEQLYDAAIARLRGEDLAPDRN